jgi:hypothetical protein
VHQAATEGGGQVIAAALDENQVEAREMVFEVLDCVKIGGDVVPDGGVRATAGLDGSYPLRRQDAVAKQEIRVLGCVDVVSDDRELQLGAERATEGRDERGLAGADRSADPDPHWVARLVGKRGRPVGVDMRCGAGVTCTVGLQ